MIRFKARYKVYDGPRIGVPKIKHYNENFWCSFNTRKQLIMCSVIYLGEDENMLQHKWYDGVIELPYGEQFPPYCKKNDPELKESINLNELYHLNCADEIVGDCELLEVSEIVWDNYDIRHHPDGTI